MKLWLTLKGTSPFRHVFFNGYLTFKWRRWEWTPTFHLVDWLIIPNIYYVEHVDSAQKRKFPDHSLSHWCLGMDILLSYCYVGIEAEIFLQLWLVPQNLLLAHGRSHLFIVIKASFSLHIIPSAVQYEKIYNYHRQLRTQYETKFYCNTRLKFLLESNSIDTQRHSKVSIDDRFCYTYSNSAADLACLLQVSWRSHGNLTWIFHTVDELLVLGTLLTYII